ncbi:MAG TPA: type II toxin-antitoxin system RelE/ParE family toxin [Spirochaetota bacterium]|nr:type II toxin-antitoxin system RelE/ParE family toxin [Spirochaetota bacterium]
MIQSFKCKETEKIWNQEYSKKFSEDIQRAKELKDLLAPPANRLEKLKGDRKNQYSIHINDQYRICFRWEDSNVFDVEIVDYH